MSSVEGYRQRKHIKKKITVFFILVALLAPCSSASAQQPAQTVRLGALLASSASAEKSRIEAFREGLRDLGYIEGKNIVIEWRYADLKLDRLLELAAELVRLKISIIVTGGSTSTRAAKQVTTTIPIVMGQSNDPVGEGFVASLALRAGTLQGCRPWPRK